MTKNQIDQDTSRAITGVRFLLMVFVVFIHAGVLSFTDAEGNEIFYEIPLVADKVIFFVQQILTRCAVPLFFFISGYIMVLKNEDYKTMIKKKLRTLVIPFFLWPILYILAYSILRELPFLHSFVNKPENPYFHKTFIEWIEVFFGRIHLTKANELPTLVFQFWYIRDLIILFLISPILKKLLEKFPYCLLWFAVLAWMQRSNLKQGNVSQSICFFTMGMFAGKHGFTVNHLEKIKFTELGIFLLITICTDILLSHFEKPFSIAHEFNVFGFSILFLKLANRWQKNEKVFKVLKYLSGFSFWLFAFHQPLLQPNIVKIYRKLFPTEGWLILPEFFITTILTIAISLAIGIALKKLAPKVFAILTGGR